MLNVERFPHNLREPRSQELDFDVEYSANRRHVLLVVEVHHRDGYQRHRRADGAGATIYVCEFFAIEAFGV